MVLEAGLEWQVLERFRMVRLRAEQNWRIYRGFRAGWKDDKAGWSWGKEKGQKEKINLQRPAAAHPWQWECGSGLLPCPCIPWESPLWGRCSRLTHLVRPILGLELRGNNLCYVPPALWSWWAQALAAYHCVKFSWALVWEWGWWVPCWHWRQWMVNHCSQASASQMQQGSLKGLNIEPSYVIGEGEVVA